MSFLTNVYDPAYRDGIIAVAILVATIAVALLIQRVLFRFLERTFSRSDDGIVAALLRRAGPPAGFAFPLMAALIAIPDLTFPPDVDAVLVKMTAVATVIAVAWAVIASIGLYADLVKHRYKLDVEDNLRARQVETRIDILGRTAVTIVVLIGFALAAMVFPAVRVLGTTLLASAGVAGIVLGIAARPLFENLIAARAADSHRRRRDRRGRVRPYRADRIDVRGRPHLGSAPHGAAADLLHRKAVSELDAHRFGTIGHGVPLRRLRRAGRPRSR